MNFILDIPNYLRSMGTYNICENVTLGNDKEKLELKITNTIKT